MQGRSCRQLVAVTLLECSSALTHVCLERSRWAVKLCGTLLSAEAGGEMVGTAGQGI